MPSIYVIIIAFLLLSWAIQAGMKSRFNKYSKIRLPNGMTGRDIAEKMLRDHGITGVKVETVRGKLTDHYNPATKTINLSEPVFASCSIAAAAVAAHECGHAVQHAHAYHFLTMRSKLVPAVSVASRWMQWVLLAGVLLLETFPALLLFGIGLFALTTLFSFITLPVEINASTRAVTWLEHAGITDYDTQPKAKSALRWAAYTYVVAALGSLATLLYYIMIFLNGQRR